MIAAVKNVVYRALADRGYRLRATHHAVAEANRALRRAIARGER